MSLFFANKMVRLLLALSVSIWMAGGCYFGCSNSAMAAGVVNDSTPTTEAGESCHAVESHHCCAPKKAKKQVVRTVRQPAGLQSFVPAPHDVMKECPFVVNSTAATSKSSTHGPDPGRVPVAGLPSLGEQTVHVDNISVVSFLPNRGPTHLRCCVFLI
jgi:hypothetical protein